MRAYSPLFLVFLTAVLSTHVSFSYPRSKSQKARHCLSCLNHKPVLQAPVERRQARANDYGPRIQQQHGPSVPLSRSSLQPDDAPLTTHVPRLRKRSPQDPELIRTLSGPLHASNPGSTLAHGEHNRPGDGKPGFDLHNEHGKSKNREAEDLQRAAYACDTLLILSKHLRQYVNIKLENRIRSSWSNLFRDIGTTSSHWARKATELSQSGQMLQEWRSLAISLSSLERELAKFFEELPEAPHRSKLDFKVGINQSLRWHVEDISAHFERVERTQHRMTERPSQDPSLSTIAEAHAWKWTAKRIAEDMETLGMSPLRGSLPSSVFWATTLKSRSQGETWQHHRSTSLSLRPGLARVS